jgi:hypothetical protein
MSADEQTEKLVPAELIGDKLTSKSSADADANSSSNAAAPKSVLVEPMQDEKQEAFESQFVQVDGTIGGTGYDETSVEWVTSLAS